MIPGYSAACARKRKVQQCEKKVRITQALARWDQKPPITRLRASNSCLLGLSGEVHWRQLEVEVDVVHVP